jgi:hypothetical protein
MHICGQRACHEKLSGPQCAILRPSDAGRTGQRPRPGLVGPGNRSLHQPDGRQRRYSRLLGLIVVAHSWRVAAPNIKHPVSALRRIKGTARRPTSAHRTCGFIPNRAPAAMGKFPIDRCSSSKCLVPACKGLKILPIDPLWQNVRGGREIARLSKQYERTGYGVDFRYVVTATSRRISIPISSAQSMIRPIAS